MRTELTAAAELDQRKYQLSIWTFYEWSRLVRQAFGAAGALEAAYYRATGKPTLFSEQMLVDCTWDLYEGELSNKGCYGAARTGYARSCVGRLTVLTCFCSHIHSIDLGLSPRH